MRFGVDIGSCYLKAVRLDPTGRVVDARFCPHNGQPLQEILRFREESPGDIVATGITGSLSSLIPAGPVQRIDEIQAMIRGSTYLDGGLQNILYLGAGSISLIKLNEKGELIDLRTNSACAAGTGSFLDQQAERMQINISEYARFRGMDDPPSVAARCAVFAKSDLIHRQQEGYTIPQLWCGLCRGLSFTIAHTLLLGEVLKGRTGVIGGVALNTEVIRWLKHIIGQELHVIEPPHLATAIGAALLAPASGKRIWTLGVEPASRPGSATPSAHRRPPLFLKRSTFPEEEVHRRYVDSRGNEVRILQPLLGRYSVSLGMDIGSTSTKIAVLDDQDRVLLDIYRRTLGDPIGAMKKLLASIREVLQTSGAAFEFLACGTTGSGRKLVGQIMGADKIVNEITAHARGAMILFGPDIETIFEIGGQDAKYVHMVQGRVDHVNMNYVCAAGTGSFVEEQAHKLGIRLEEIGDIVLGIAPPFTSERCTVFMERDVEKLLREGYSRQEAMAAVLYSVCFNYLTKVVGNRPVTGDRILFQGATAKNKGLVAAFEIIMEREILTSHFCHVTGAIGAARLARDRTVATGKASAFRGLDLYRRKVEVYYDECGLCVNRCKITHARIEGMDTAPSWGYMCGREPEDTRKKANPFFKPFETRRALFMGAEKQRAGPAPRLTVTMPRALATYAHLPFWRAFFGRLGVELRITDPTSRETVEAGISSSPAEFCFPVKVFLGHVSQALRPGHLLFIPHLIAGERTRFTTRSVFCPYVQAAPSIARSSELLAARLGGHLLNPVIDFSMPDSVNVRELYGCLRPWGIGRNRIARAWKAGLEALRDYRNRSEQEGRRILEEIRQTGEKAVIVVGRYYNIYDGGINLEIPRKISELGYRVVPYEFIPFHETNLDPFFQNMFWFYGQRILNAARFVKEHKNLFLLYLTNFSCGPDSFLLTYVEEILGEKPFLTLELDEHSADTGYGTRIEAFADLMADYGEGRPRGRSLLYEKPSSRNVRGKTVLFVPMHEAVVPMFAAAFQKHGYKTLVLPEITPEQFELGRKHTRGSECLPAHVTAGNILHALEAYGLKASEAALFMPTSDGPCRFGQYATLDRIILNKLGYEDLTILSPSAQNAYMGLENGLRKDLWKAILVGDVVFKLYCRTAPYELRPGEARRTFDSAVREAASALRRAVPFTEIIRDAAAAFSRIETSPIRKPLVGIVGEIFVRCNPFSCDRVVDSILEAGAEPWLAPISEWILFTSYIHRYEARKRRNLGEMLQSFLKNRFLHETEHEAYEAAGDLLRDRREPSMPALIEAGERYFPIEFNAEAILSAGRACLFIERDGADMIVNVSPFTCMPGTITGAIFRQMSSQEGIPIVNMYYDGTVGMNEKVTTFLRNLRAQAGKAPTEDSAVHPTGPEGEPRIARPGAGSGF